MQTTGKKSCLLVLGGLEAAFSSVHGPSAWVEPPSTSSQLLITETCTPPLLSNRVSRMRNDQKTSLGFCSTDVSTKEQTKKGTPLHCRCACRHDSNTSSWQHKAVRRHAPFSHEMLGRCQDAKCLNTISVPLIYLRICNLQSHWFLKVSCWAFSRIKLWKFPSYLFRRVKDSLSTILYDGLILDIGHRENKAINEMSQSLWIWRAIIKNKMHGISGDCLSYRQNQSDSA